MGSNPTDFLWGAYPPPMYLENQRSSGLDFWQVSCPDYLLSKNTPPTPGHVINLLTSAYRGVSAKTGKIAVCEEITARNQVKFPKYLRKFHHDKDSLPEQSYLMNHYMNWLSWKRQNFDHPDFSPTAFDSEAITWPHHAHMTPFLATMQPTK